MKQTILRECERLAKEKNTPELHDQWGNYHHFSFVVQSNKILAWGMNRAGKPPVKGGYNQAFGKIHSETDAYRKARGILDHDKPFEVVNIRLNKRNKLRISKPCKCCYNFLQQLNCKAVYFSTEVGFAKVKM